MSVRNSLRVREYGQLFGIDTTSQPANTAAGFLRTARNANLFVTAGVEKRKGYVNQLETPWDTNAITAGIEFVQTSFEPKIITFSPTSQELVDITSGTPIVLRSDILSEEKPSLVQFEDRLFFFNGEEKFIYDAQNGVRSIGIPAPATAPTKDAETAGSMNTGPTDTYVYVYTYYNSRTEAESSPSPSLTGVTTASGGVTVGVTPGNALIADKIRVYRTVGGGTQLILEGEADIAATTFASGISDTELGVAFSNRLLELDNSLLSDLTDEARYAIIADNRVFVVTGTNEIRFSKIGQSGPMPESFQITALVETESRYGSTDPIVGLGQIKDRVIVLKQRSIGFLEPVGIRGISDSVDPVQYIYRETSDVTGAISHFAGSQAYADYVFLGRDNVYATDGINLRPVGNAIQDTVRAMGFAEDEINQYSCISDTQNKRLYISGFVATASAEPNFQLVGDYQTGEFRWTTYTEGDNNTTHPGLNVGCFFTIQNPTNGALEIFFGDSRDVGKYYKMNTSDSDDGNPIWFEVITRGYHFEQPLATKLFKDQEILGKAESQRYTLTLCHRLDFSPKDLGCTPCPLPVAGGQWEPTAPKVFKWGYADTSLNGPDTLVWAGSQVDIVTFDLHTKAKHLQLVFRQTDADAPITLIAWGSVAVVFGRE